MSRVSTYLNFAGNTGEVFHFYKSVFGGEFNGGIARFKDMPESPATPEIPDDEKNLIMHIELPITGGHILMGSDVPQSMGFDLEIGNNVLIVLEPDSKEETDRLFEELSTDGTVTMPLQHTFWGAYYGTCIDKYGVQWMFSYYAE